MCFEEEATDVPPGPIYVDSLSTHVVWVFFDVPYEAGGITVTLQHFEDPTQVPGYPIWDVAREKNNYRRLVEWVERHEEGDKIPVTCTLTKFLLFEDISSSKPLVVPQLGCILVP